jgi:hypothetical protein
VNFYDPQGLQRVPPGFYAGPSESEGSNRSAWSSTGTGHIYLTAELGVNAMEQVIGRDASTPRRRDRTEVLLKGQVRRTAHRAALHTGYPAVRLFRPRRGGSAVERSGKPEARTTGPVARGRSLLWPLLSGWTESRGQCGCPVGVNRAAAQLQHGCGRGRQ